MAGDAAELCMSLMRADSEDEVVGLLEAAGYWDDPRYWRFLDDNEGNYSAIGNQQGEAVAALIEKLVNAVDARLTNACFEAGIDPTSAEAPQSMREAVARFFEHSAHPGRGDAGRISTWPAALVTEEGKQITLTATGSMPQAGNPSLSIADSGEGQAPDSFPDTFMSLERNNKLRVQFVQGKFNMGGTGAFQFSSHDHRLQLIVSRRNPSLLSPEAPDRDAEWGFTVVRREAGDSGSRNSVYTYLAPVGVALGRDGGVLSFPAEEWPIFPEVDNTRRDAYARSAHHGSLVKLYEYRWQGVRSNIVSSGEGLLRRVDLGLPELALPIRLYECRAGYKGHSGSFDTNVLGLATRLDKDKAKRLEPGFPIGTVIDLDGRPVRVRVFALSGNAKDYRTSSHGLVFYVNGQTHAHKSIDFFRRRAVGMSQIAESLVVLVDCTEIQGRMREDLFMNSRDRLRDDELAVRLERELERILSSEQALKALRNRRREEEIAERLDDSKPLANALGDLVRQSPLLKKLLGSGIAVPSPFPTSGTGRGGASDFEGKPFPTYFRFKGKADDEELHRPAHLGSRVRVAFETDAADDYFHRDLDPGAAEVLVDTGEGRVPLTGWSFTGPRSGVANLQFDLPAGSRVDDTIPFEVRITDPSRIDAFGNSGELTIRKEAKPSSGGSGERDRNRNAGKGSGGALTGLSLPEIIPVHEDNWEKHDFDELSGLKVVHQGTTESGTDRYDFYVNVDNKYLKVAQKESRFDPNLLRAKFTYGLVLLGLGVLADERTKNESSDITGATDLPSPEILVRAVSRRIAPFVLPTLDSIGALDEGIEP